jgi:hypothetical protein
MQKYAAGEDMSIVYFTLMGEGEGVAGSMLLDSN